MHNIIKNSEISIDVPIHSQEKDMQYSLQFSNEHTHGDLTYVEGKLRRVYIRESSTVYSGGIIKYGTGSASCSFFVKVANAEYQSIHYIRYEHGVMDEEVIYIQGVKITVESEEHRFMLSLEHPNVISDITVPNYLHSIRQKSIGEWVHECNL